VSRTVSPSGDGHRLSAVRYREVEGPPIPETRHPTPAIQTTHLQKAYGSKIALHDLDLAVQPGEVFGFLGPNGAGKTTTVKILLGLVRATSGEARIFGQPAGDPITRQRIGYLPENFRFHDWLTGSALLDFHGRLAGLSPAERRERIPHVLDQVGLSGRGNDRINSYSKGMAQRIGLAQAILHEPDLVLLDEPTSALDPVGRREVRDLIHSLRARGMTVFLNSHLLSEVEMVCDRVAIVDRGRVVRSGRLNDLIGGVPELRVTLDRIDAPVLELLRRHGEIVHVQDATVTLGVVDLEVGPRVAEALVGSGYRLYGLVPSHQSLEEVFLSLVQKNEP
jgi:ABC-2 type transport system ATP-binding protein